MKIIVETAETIYPCIKVYANKKYNCITYVLFTSTGSGILLSTTSDELEDGEVLSYSTSYSEELFTPVPQGTVFTFEA